MRVARPWARPSLKGSPPRAWAWGGHVVAPKAFGQGHEIFAVRPFGAGDAGVGASPGPRPDTRPRRQHARRQ
eukprot:5429970-Pyramimonas_sp.AAC.1